VLLMKAVSFKWRASCLHLVFGELFQAGNYFLLLSPSVGTGERSGEGKE